MRKSLSSNIVSGVNSKSGAGYTIPMRRLTSLAVTALLLFPALSSAATLYFDPSEGIYGPGDTFAVNVRLNTEGECINAGEITVFYPKDNLRATDFSRGSSIFSLWVTEPTIHPDAGSVTFSGGVPGGYCGRIQGDPSVTNVLGKIIFMVTNSNQKKAALSFAPSSKIYANDGLGTVITPTTHTAEFSLVEKRQNAEDPWLAEVAADTILPDAFVVQVESIPSIFGVKYYLIFTTIDKQSGLDHFEILDRGAWKQIVSPYELRNQSLHSNVQVRAVDKAGNVRLGEYKEGIVVASASGKDSMSFVLILLGVLALLTFVRMYMNRKMSDAPSGPVA